MPKIKYIPDKSGRLCICVLWSIKKSRLRNKTSINCLFPALPLRLYYAACLQLVCYIIDTWCNIYFVFIFEVPLILAMKLQCIQLHRPITSSSSSNRNKQWQQQQLLLLQQPLGQGPPLLKRHHSKISNWNQNNLPNHPRSTTAMFVRSAVLDHRYLYYVIFCYTFLLQFLQL